MKVRLETYDGNPFRGILHLAKEPGDPRCTDGTWGCGESRVLYHVKQQIIAGKVEGWPKELGTDWIKKRMGKDGHLVCSSQLYIRSRKPVVTDKDGDKLHACLSNTHWAIRGINDDLNDPDDGHATLQLELCGVSSKEIYKHSHGA